MNITRKMTRTCERCGKKVETDDLGVRECAHCENIKFDRDSLISLEKEFYLNFQGVLQSDLKSAVKALYMFGSYAMGRPQCGDIDYLLIINEEELKKLVEDEIDIFHSQFDLVDDILEQSGSESVIDDSFWDYRTCREYPDCLDCHGTRGCKLPKDDYNAPLHTFCLERCEKGYPYPVCLDVDCYYLKGEVKNHIFKRLLRMLTEGDIDYREYAPGQKVKVIDIVKKNSVKELIEEFQRTDPEKELKIVELWKK